MIANAIIAMLEACFGSQEQYTCRQIETAYASLFEPRAHCVKARSAKGLLRQLIALHGRQEGYTPHEIRAAYIRQTRFKQQLCRIGE